MPDVYPWLSTIIPSVIAAVFGSKLLADYLAYRRKKHDGREAVKVEAAGKEIDADVNAFNSIYRRLEAVEGRLDTVQNELMEQKVENAKLEAENDRLAKDNERQEKEIERQRQKLHSLAGDLQNKELQIVEMNSALKRRQEEIEVLRSELHETTMGLNTLKKQIAGEPTQSKR